MQIINIKECLNNHLVLYRNMLTIPRNIKFGLELELEDVTYDEIDRLITRQFGNSWKVKEDRSLKKDKNAEIAIPPLYNDKQTWISLKKLAKVLDHVRPTYENCSFQINFDGSLFPEDKYKIKFIKLFAVYEDIIYRFSMGNNSDYRESIDTYAYPIMLAMKAYDGDGLIELLSNQKRYGINFKTRNLDLIEFRTPNASSDPITWQNYITFFYYLIQYSLSPKCNEKLLDEYIEEFNKIDLLDYYKKCNVEKAYQLSLKLFNNQTDKLNFLSQYIK